MTELRNDLETAIFPFFNSHDLTRCLSQIILDICEDYVEGQIRGILYSMDYYP